MGTKSSFLDKGQFYNKSCAGRFVVFYPDVAAIEYDSPVDALVAVAKRLSIYEDRYRMASEEFFDKFCKGQMEDSMDFVEWGNDYQYEFRARVTSRFDSEIFVGRTLLIAKRS